MWMLGDDDAPRGDAVATILREIGSAPPNCCFVNFSTTFFQYPDTTDSGSVREALRMVKARPEVSNFLFISAGIYRMAAIQPFLMAGYQNTYTCAPHLAMALMALGTDNWAMRFSKNFLVDWELPPPGDSWNVLGVFCGVPGLYELELASDRGATLPLVKVLLTSCRWNLFGLAGSMLIFCDHERTTRWWLLVLSRAAILGVWKVRWQCICMILLLPFASIGWFRSLIAKILVSAFPVFCKKHGLSAIFNSRS
jgi:hypothetical protein